MGFKLQTPEFKICVQLLLHVNKPSSLRNFRLFAELLWKSNDRCIQVTENIWYVVPFLKKIYLILSKHCAIKFIYVLFESNNTPYKASIMVPNSWHSWVSVMTYKCLPQGYKDSDRASLLNSCVTLLCALLTYGIGALQVYFSPFLFNSFCYIYANSVNFKDFMIFLFKKWF